MTCSLQLEFKRSLPSTRELGHHNSPPLKGEMPMNLESGWNVYRTRFVVRARRLTDSLIFTDALGRQQSGQPGDYLVEIFDGLLSITPRKFFEDIYVPLEPPANDSQGNQAESQPRATLRDGHSASQCSPRQAGHLPPQIVNDRGSPLHRAPNLVVPRSSAGAALTA